MASIAVVRDQVDVHLSPSNRRNLKNFCYNDEFELVYTSNVSACTNTKYDTMNYSITTTYGERKKKEYETTTKTLEISFSKSQYKAEHRRFSST